MSHGGRDSEDIRPRSGCKVRGDVRVHHSFDNNPRPGVDKNDRGEGDHEFHESPAVRGREGGPYAGRGVVRDAGRPVEGAQDNVDHSVHVEQDQVHVRSYVRLRQTVRRLSVQGRSGDRDEERVDQVHERRDSEMRVRDIRRLRERAREHILQIRSSGVPIGDVQAEFDDIRAQELAQVGQIAQPEDPARPHREVFLSAGRGHDRGEEEGGRARVGHAATVDGHAIEEERVRGEERHGRVRDSQSRVQLLLRERGHDGHADKPDCAHAGRESRRSTEASGGDRRGSVGERGASWIRRYTGDEVSGRGDERGDEVSSDPVVRGQGVRRDLRIAARAARRPPFQTREGDEHLVPRQSDPPRSEIFRESGEVRPGQISQGWEEHRELGGVHAVRDGAQEVHRQQVRVDRDENIAVQHPGRVQLQGREQDYGPVEIQGGCVQSGR